VHITCMQGRGARRVSGGAGTVDGPLAARCGGRRSRDDGVGASAGLSRPLVGWAPITLIGANQTPMPRSRLTPAATMPVQLGVSSPGPAE